MSVEEEAFIDAELLKLEAKGVISKCAFFDSQNVFPIFTCQKKDELWWKITKTAILTFLLVKRATQNDEKQRPNSLRGYDSQICYLSRNFEDMELLPTAECIVLIPCRC